MNILNERYEIQRYLDQRLDRQTLLALDRQTQNLVLIKLIIFGGNLKWEMFKLFEGEAKILQELEHLAIPRYVDYFDVETDFGKGFALVQSYINAQSLEGHIKAGLRFSEKELQHIAIEVLNLLIYLQSHHPPIIHRDIQPANILLDNNEENSLGTIYLVNFGSVQDALSEEDSNPIVGTYGYMPPEQFGGRATPASDLYSLGATIIYLASGYCPKDLPQADFQVDFENYVSLSPSFINWLKWMTQFSLERRLTSANEALLALKNPNFKKNFKSVASKPSYSKIVLTKKNELLEIFIPPKGFSPDLLTTIGVAIFWSTLSIYFCFDAINFWNLESLIFLYTLYLGIKEILLVLFNLFGKIWLSVNQEQISLEYCLFGFKFNYPSPASRDKISKLEINKAYLKKDSEGGEVKVKPQICIWAGTKRFVIGKGLIKETELIWLGYELSLWLDLPITRVNSVV